MTIRAVVFDAYGTLFDVGSVIDACETHWPGQGASLSALWRSKQLEYTWLRSLMGRYADFWQVTGEALTFACARLGLSCDEAAHAALMNEYLGLAPFAEVRATLEQLSTRPLAILSNGSPTMLNAVVTNAGLEDTFAHVLSVDGLGVYKPDPRVYQLAVDTLGLAAREILFVSSNSWDAVGARAFGFTVCWCNRARAPLDELGVTVDLVVNDLAQLADTLV